MGNKFVASSNSARSIYAFESQFAIKNSLVYVLISQGKLYSWGKKSQSTIMKSPILFSLPNNERIAFITCGINHTICLTENNLCYVWGDNKYGQLGLGYLTYLECLIDNLIEISIPTLLTLPNNEKISFITCGDYHTICLTESNSCYVWGWNLHGELGLGDRVNHYVPTLLTLPNNERIYFITCGANHTVCLTESNLCYVWGWNLHGELGLGDRVNHYVPTLFSLPNNERISFITCGINHTMCLTENNLCYVWGDNEYGQLGLGDTTTRSIPTSFSLPNNERIFFITCKYHTICLTENNLSYVWGWNEYGQLGLGDKITRSAPTLLTLPFNERISFITCGINHTICLTANNLCYVWGDNSYGKLGLGDLIARLTPTLLILPNI